MLIRIWLANIRLFYFMKKFYLCLNEMSLDFSVKGGI